MVAVPNEHAPVPTSSRSMPGARAGTGAVAARRAVAIAVGAMEMLRPRSDLVRLLASFDSIELLLVADDRSREGGIVPLSTDHAIGGPDDASRVVDLAALDLDVDDGDIDDEMDEDDPDDDPAEAILLGIAGLGLNAVTVHRLGFPDTFGAEAEGDVVAAVSELVGFDPEPGVYCLAPVAGLDEGRATVGRAAQRIAQVYGIPLLRYRCFELSVVSSDSP